MYWTHDSRYRAGGFWRCAVKVAEKNLRRVRIGNIYLGTVGFSELERSQLLGKAK